MAEIRSWFRRKNSREVQEHIVADFREVFFSTESGRRVLTYLLSEACFFSEATNDEHQILQNFARRILRDCGIWTEGNSKEIVDSLSTNVTRRVNV